MNENQKDLDAVGEVIRREKRRRVVKLQAKFVGWLIVVLVAFSFILLFTKTAN